MSQGFPNATRRSKAEVAALLGQLHGDMPKAALIKAFGRKVLRHPQYEDMAQEVWLGLVMSAHSFTPGRGKVFRQWAYGNAINYARNTLRKPQITAPQNRAGVWLKAVPLSAFEVGEKGERAQSLPEVLRQAPEQEEAFNQDDGQRMWRELRRHLTRKGTVSARMGGEWYLRHEYEGVYTNVLALEAGTSRQNVDRRIRSLKPAAEQWAAQKRQEAA